MTVSTVFYVHRVLQWPDGIRLVEVSEGRDSADPGVLGAKYPELGEFKEYSDPRCAAIAACRIAKQWETDEPIEDELIDVSAIGLIGELGVPSEGMDFRELFAWARRRYDLFPVCHQCGDKITGETYRLLDSLHNDEVFCSESHAEDTWWAWNDEQGV